MKTVQLIICTLALAISLGKIQAQTLIGPKLGIKASIPMASEEAYDAGLNAVAGFSFGVQSETQLTKKIFLRSGLIYNTRGLAIDLVGDGDVGDLAFNYTESINYLDVPMALSFKLGGDKFGLGLNLGTTIGYAISGNRKADLSFSDGVDSESVSDAEAIDFADSGYQRLNAAVLLGGGIYTKIGAASVFAELEMDMGLTSLSKEDDIKQLGLGLNVGILVPFGKK